MSSRTVTLRARHRAGAIPRWLGWYMFLLPLGIPILTYLVPSDFCILAGIAASLAGFRRENAGQPRLGHPASFLLAWIGFCFLGVLIPDHPDFFAFDIASTLWVVLSALCVRHGLRDREGIDQAVRELNKLFLPLVLFCIGGLAAHWMGLDDWTGGVFSFRLYLPFRFPILLGAYLVAAYPFAVIWTGLPFKRRIVHEILYLIVISGIGARSCMIVAIGQVIWTEWNTAQDSRTLFPRWLRFGVFFTAACSAGLVLSSEFTFQRSLGVAGVEAFAKDVPRERQYERAFDHLPDWITGIGLGCFKGRYGEELHNTPVNLLVETGIGGLLAAHAGLLAAFLPLAAGVRRMAEPWKTRVNALLCAGAGLYVLGLFHNLLRNRYVWLVLALSLAMSHAAPSSRSPARDDSPA
ncbi:MAG TPA: hypothetical protein PLU72_10940 [Candidatus Ozemobacteraceae bacterium]|nr:hypothetical protein [Candidatus Ozemobacteraceae bacterium]